MLRLIWTGPKGKCHEDFEDYKGVSCFIRTNYNNRLDMGDIIDRIFMTTPSAKLCNSQEENITAFFNKGYTKTCTLIGDMNMKFTLIGGIE